MRSAFLAAGVSELRAIKALRVVDASIRPDIPSVSTNVTTIVVAERIAAKLSASK
jgi:choline dehydrogenase